MVGRPVVAIGLDAADHGLIDMWVADGHLPNLARLRKRGSYRTLRHMAFYSDETPWTNFLTGCTPQKTGFWSQFHFSPKSYDTTFSPYDFGEFRPFYAIDEERSVCVFDVPHCPVLFPKQPGVQVLGWGAHAAMGPLQSNPPGLCRELTDRFGEHLGVPIEYGGEWTNQPYLDRLHAALIDSIDRKKQICLDLLARQRWDLFLTVFSEAHMALHKFWHLSDPTHALYNAHAQSGRNPLRDVYVALDTAVGAIADRVADHQVDLMIFSVHGSVANCYDLPSMVYLPELLYRYSFPGRHYLCRNQVTDGELPALPTSQDNDEWLRSVWQQTATTPVSVATLRQWSLARRLLYRMHPRLFSQPLSWLERRWPKMKAFALPTYGDGYVRVNLKGREARGTVSADDYDTVCDEITDMLNALRNPRNGEPVVKEVVRTRSDRRSRGPHEPDADLVVIWRQPPATMVSSPTLGVLGPLPFRETGGHRPEGFLMACGQGIAENAILGPGDVTDLAPTVLSRLGSRIPDYMDGRNLLDVEERELIGGEIR
jgi:predicted AlkP superfamily phosphohydrolase/phosphomutase